MKAIKPLHQLLSGYAEMPISLDNMLSNMLTIVLSGNRRSVIRPPISIFPLQGEDEALSLTYWMDKTLDDDYPNESFELQEDGDDDRAVGLMLTNKQRLLLASFAGGRRDVKNDIGDYLATELTRVKHIGTEYVFYPSTAYPRPYYSLEIGMPAMAEDKAIPENRRDRDLRQRELFRMISPRSDWARNIGHIFLSMEWPLWTAGIVPGLAERMVEGHNVKDRGMGEAMAKRDQLRVVAGCMWAHPHIGPLLRLHALRRFHDLMVKEGTVRLKGSVNHIQVWEENRQLLLAQPLPQLASLIANALSTGTVDTNNGTREPLYNPSPIDNITIEHYRHDLLALFEAEVHHCALSKPKAWTDVTADTELTILDYVRSLNSSGLADGMAHGARVFGWSGMSASLGEIDFSAADFALTDGEYVSKEPIQLALGMTPTLSHSNRKLFGIGRRYAEDFNTAVSTRIEYSILPVWGHITEADSELVLERNWLPAGATMGETETEYVGAYGSKDKMEADVLHHYIKQQHAGYIRERYVTPEQKVNAPASVRFTSWDVYAASGTKDATATDLLTIYNGQVQTITDPDAPIGSKIVNITEISMVYRQKGFHLRVPVKRARAQKLIAFTLDFQYWKTYEQDGNLVYDNEVNLSHSADLLQAIVDVLPLTPPQIQLPKPETEVASEGPSLTT